MWNNSTAELAIGSGTKILVCIAAVRCRWPNTRRIGKFIRFTSVQYNAAEWEIFASASRRIDAFRRHANPRTASILNFQRAHCRINASRMESSIRQFFGSSTRRQWRRRWVSGVPITGSRELLSIGKLIILYRGKPASRKPRNFRARTVWLKVPLLLRYADVSLRSLILSVWRERARTLAIATRRKSYNAYENRKFYLLHVTRGKIKSFVIIYNKFFL